jgi:hypothetical protein
MAVDRRIEDPHLHNNCLNSRVCLEVVRQLGVEAQPPGHLDLVVKIYPHFLVPILAGERHICNY